MTQYKEVIQGENTYIERTDENGQVWAIPMLEENADYQRYLAWLEDPEAEQSTPMVTDEAATL